MTWQEKIFHRVAEAVAEVIGRPLETVLKADNLADEFGIDSLDSMEIVMELEQRFDIDIPEADFPNMTTVSAIADVVERLMRSN